MARHQRLDKSLHIRGDFGEEDRQSAADTQKLPVPDPAFKSKRVHGLDSCTFDKFVNPKNVVMVMFYKPCDKNLQTLQKEFDQAACSTKRENHAYAAVDCSCQSSLCSEQNVDATPVFVVYTKGSYVGSIRDVKNFKTENMRQYVELCPVIKATACEDTFA